MKITQSIGYLRSLLSLLLLFHVSLSFSQDSNNEIPIRLSEQNYEFAELISLIEKQANIKFVFNPSEFPAQLFIPNDKIVNVGDFLDYIKERYKISVKRMDDTIYLKLSEEIIISGQITDGDTGEPLVGATVKLQNSSLGSTANLDGYYEFLISEDNFESRVEVTFVGFITQGFLVTEIPANVVMKLDIQNLDEVMVVGYGSQKKSDITGAMSRVGSADLEKIASTNPIQAIQGLAAGVDVIPQSFGAGQEPVVRIRGERSLLASNDPLIILDGIPYQGSINDINPIEISSIEILKDASSTAIYGSRAANGVILITTKRGSGSGSDGLSVEINGSYGISQPLQLVDMMDRLEFIQFRREAERTRFNLDELPPINEAFSPFEIERISRSESTDWQDAIYGQGSIESLSVGVGGMKEGKRQFFLSLDESVN